MTKVIGVVYTERNVTSHLSFSVATGCRKGTFFLDSFTSPFIGLKTRKALSKASNCKGTSIPPSFTEYSGNGLVSPVTGFQSSGYVFTWLDPRTARLAPSRTVKDADLYVKFRSFLQRCMQDFPPFVRKHPDFPIRNSLPADISYESSGYACFFHRQKVFFDSTNRYVVGHPIPVYSQAYAVGHLLKSFSYHFYTFFRKAVLSAETRRTTECH